MIELRAGPLDFGMAGPAIGGESQGGMRRVDRGLEIGLMTIVARGLGSVESIRMAGGAIGSFVRAV